MPTTEIDWLCLATVRLCFSVISATLLAWYIKLFVFLVSGTTTDRNHIPQGTTITFMNTLDPTNLLLKNQENNPPDWLRLFVNASKNSMNDKVHSVAYGTYYYDSVGVVIWSRGA